MLARSHSIATLADSNADVLAQDNVVIVIQLNHPDLRGAVERLTGSVGGVEVVLSPEIVPAGQRNHRSEWRGAPARNGRHAREVVTRRIVIGTLNDATGLVNAVMSGTWAVVTPDAETLESSLPGIVREVAAGNCPLMRQIAGHPPAASLLFSRLSAAKGSPERKNVPSPLTAIETEILLRISHGHTSRRIAEDMGFQLQTVKNKVTAILNKTAARTRGQAAAAAQANGWIGAR